MVEKVGKASPVPAGISHGNNMKARQWTVTAGLFDYVSSADTPSGGWPDGGMHALLSEDPGGR